MPRVNPDYIIIPFSIVSDKKLQPLDRTLYGIVYWFEKMKDGECYASNITLASYIGSTSSTIQNSLLRLEKNGYIQRDFKDKEKKTRARIRCLVTYDRVPRGDGTVPSGDGTCVPSGDDHNKKILINKSSPSAVAGEWTWKEYLEKTRDNKQRHIAIIGEYWFFKEFSFSSREQADVDLRQSLRPAKDLALYDGDRVTEVMDWLYANADFKWTLSSVLKYINEDLSKLKKGRPKNN